MTRANSKFDKDAAFKAITGLGKEKGEDQSPAEEKIQSESVKTSGSKYVIPIKKKETRSQRVTVLMKPSVYAEAKNKCGKLGISVSECFNQFFEKWITEEE